MPSQGMLSLPGVPSKQQAKGEGPCQGRTSCFAGATISWVRESYGSAASDSA
jgi:hypothetical protein